MKKKQIVTIAEKTNTSPTTVSKVLNHRHGVSSDVRQLVFSEYDRMGGKKKEEPVSVYVILPEIPQYFWGSECPTPTEEGLRIKYNIYSRIGDDEMVLRYLHQAIELKAQVIIIAARLNDCMRELLDDFSRTGLVIYLTEYNQTQNSVYVGSDPAEDGRQLAHLFRRHIGENDQLMTFHHLGETSRIRRDVFLKELDGVIPCAASTIDFSADTSLMPSLIARELLPLLEKGTYTKLICFSGFTHVLCLALQKMHLPFPVQCFGFENTAQNEKFAKMGLLGGVVSQNFPAQMASALSLAADFVTNGCRPPQERIIIPCNIFEY